MDREEDKKRGRLRHRQTKGQADWGTGRKKDRHGDRNTEGWTETATERVLKCVERKSGYSNIVYLQHVHYTHAAQYKHLHYSKEGVLMNGVCCSESGGASLSSCLLLSVAFSCFLAVCPFSCLSLARLYSYNPEHAKLTHGLKLHRRIVVTAYELWRFKNCRSPLGIRSPPVCESVRY